MGCPGRLATAALMGSAWLTATTTLPGWARGEPVERPSDAQPASRRTTRRRGTGTRSGGAGPCATRARLNSSLSVGARSTRRSRTRAGRARLTTLRPTAAAIGAAVSRVRSSGEAYTAATRSAKGGDAARQRPRPGPTRRRPGGGPAPGRAAPPRWSASGRGARGARACPWAPAVALRVGFPAVFVAIGGTTLPVTAALASVADSLESLAPSRPRSSTCRACPRLVEWRERVAAEKRRPRSPRRSTGAGPCPGFGDPAARIAGRRPGARRPRRQPHGPGVHRRPIGRLAVRRPAPVPASPTSRRATHCGDGLELTGAFVTAAVRCAPPANKPTPAERDTCRALPRARARRPARPSRVLVALGQFGYDAACRDPRRAAPTPGSATASRSRLPGGRHMLGTRTT